jgi:hypothetical protein
MMVTAIRMVTAEKMATAILADVTDNNCRRSPE